MNNKRVAVLLLVSIVILTAAPTTFARPEFLTNLTAVYGDGSCGTCHISASGGGPRNAYGTLFENQPNYATDPSAALTAIGAPPSATVTSAVTTTMTATPAMTAETPTSGFGTVTATGAATETVTGAATSSVTTIIATPAVTTIIATPEVTTMIATPVAPTETAAPAVTTVTATATPRSPGFGIVVSMVGLIALAILVRRKNR